VISTPLRSATDWLDSCCWACGSTQVAYATGDAVLCLPCREELLTEPVVDVVGLARHAYWESHALRCCWRCITRAVDQRDELGLCGSCREELGLLADLLH
jgi:hypothetical protein